MLVSTTTYYILIVVIIVLIIAFPLYARFIKKAGNKFDFIYFLLFILLPINWYTSTIYTITNCNEFTKEVLIFPTEKGGYKFEMGWYNYIINKSNETLFFEHIYYGSDEPKEDQINVEISPNSIERVGVVVIDYLFTEPEDTVRTKSSGETKTTLYCIN